MPLACRLDLPRLQKKNTMDPMMISPTMPTATPIPAFAPVERPPDDKFAVLVLGLEVVVCEAFVLKLLLELVLELALEDKRTTENAVADAIHIALVTGLAGKSWNLPTPVSQQLFV
jgi:hypothetical protein